MIVGRNKGSFELEVRGEGNLPKAEKRIKRIQKEETQIAQKF
jgi:hypothetical protein